MATVIDLSGQSFGRLTVIERCEQLRPGKTRWLCRCSCGQERRILAGSLRSGGTKSCGCLKLETNRANGRRGPDLMGRKFGRLTIIARGKNKTGQLLWGCACDCGAGDVLATTNDLYRGRDSCGCDRVDRHVDLSGMRFGRLIAMERVKGTARTRWRCRCDCGTERVVTALNLTQGTKSCGCLLKEYLASGGRKTHGATRRKNHDARKSGYSSWSAMKSRCSNKRLRDYPDYGGRGITVCERWMKFENFIADMGPRPSRSYSLDRFPDVNGNYEPGNCRWATAEEQKHNQRLSAPRVAAILARLKSESCDLLERAVLDRVRIALLGA